ncbi:Mu-like prophage FluMu protein gp47 [Spirochaetia bacterium]|nr:Mu-like prophage FluMu protein gp47 [Spirochaetia bacterium]
MAFGRDSLTVIENRIYNNYKSLYHPVDKTPRMSLLKVFSQTDSGIYHQLSGDLDFFSRQLFPDTAQGDYLRLHWSSRVPPLYAQAARGYVEVSGTPNTPLPAGTVFASVISRARYYTDKSYRVGDNGKVTVIVTAQTPGSDGNLAAGGNVKIVSSLSGGIDSTAVTVDSGIGGGADSETDEAYLVRVLSYLRTPARYGRKDDFALWAVDSSIEVTKAWEFKNFGILGSLLIIVIGGNQIDGVQQVTDLLTVRDYINSVAPPVIFTVRTPVLKPLNPAIALGGDDSESNRDIVTGRLKIYLQMVGKPLGAIAAGEVRAAIVNDFDDIVITNLTVKINGSVTGIMQTTVLEYPVPGTITWE